MVITILFEGSKKENLNAIMVPRTIVSWTRGFSKEKVAFTVVITSNVTRCSLMYQLIFLKVVVCPGLLTLHYPVTQKPKHNSLGSFLCKRSPQLTTGPICTVDFQVPEKSQTISSIFFIQFKFDLEFLKILGITLFAFSWHSKENETGIKYDNDIA
jgi:hypothetical protein